MSAKKRKKSVVGTIFKVILIILLILILFAFVVGYVFTSAKMKEKFGRTDYEAENLDPSYHYSFYEADYPRQEVSFRSGDNVLKGYIYGLNNDKGVIVFAHGISHGHEYYLSTITALVDCGWRVFAYDGTGSCTSEGEGTTGLAQSAIDMDRAVTFVENNSVFTDMPIFVLGHSWGGFASSAVLNFEHDIAAGVSLSGYSTPFAELCEFADVKYGEKSPLIYPFLWMYNQVKFGRYASLSAVEGINKSDTPVLIVHGDNDSTVAYDGASIISQKGHITNPNAEYYTFEAENKDTHNGYFKSTEYYEYYEAELKAKDSEMTSQYGEDIPDDVYAEYVASVNKDLFNAPNPELIELIDGFFEKNLTESAE